MKNFFFPPDFRRPLSDASTHLPAKHIKTNSCRLAAQGPRNRMRNSRQ